MRDNGAFWNYWSWDYEDHANTYPSGNPANPAFGFRQVMVRNHNNDYLDAQAADLYHAATKDLNLFYADKARHLLPGWWFMPGEDDPNKIHGAPFPLADSRFADDIKDFLKDKPDTPYDWRVPVASGVRAGQSAAGTAETAAAS